MLLQALIDYQRRMVGEDAQREVQAEPVPSAYQRQPIKGFLELDRGGQLQRVFPTASGDSKNDRGMLFAAPHVMRSSAIRPKLLVDNAEYVLGISKKPDGNDPKVAARHAAFIDTVRDCFEATENADVGAVLHYLTARPSPLHLWEGFDPALNYSFVVDGRRPFEEPDVQQYWASKVIGSDQADTSGGQVAESLISGEVGLVMTAEPVKIKGIPGGQAAGMNLVSANADAFLSYGLDSAGQAPILTAEAEQYANALNRLLTDDATHYALGKVVYAFWTKEGDVPPIRDALTAPSIDLYGTTEMVIASRPDQVRASLKGLWAGNERRHVTSTDFYALGLSASGSRIVMRSYIQSTVDELLDRLGFYFAAQRLTQWDGSDPKPQAMYALAASLYRSFSKESSTHDVARLLAFALSGARLPYDFLPRITARNRAERRVTYPRAVLAKMTLISQGDIAMGAMEQLDTSCPDVGYQLGRLLAVLDDVQRLAMGHKVNTTVVDRFYGSMSTTPLGVYGRLMQGVRPHLARIRKDKPGAYRRMEASLEEVSSHIAADSVPHVLTLQQQALFALGYYHQRAAISEGIHAAMQAKTTDGSGSVPQEEDNNG